MEIKDEGRKTLIEVEIFNQTFTVTSEDDERYVRELASYVDQRMRQIGGATKTVIPLRVAIMAALSVADEYYKVCKREAEMRQEIAHFSATLLERIEQSEKLGEIATSGNPASAFTADGSTATPESETKKEALSLS